MQKTAPLSHKQYNEMGLAIVNMMESQRKLRKQQGDSIGSGNFSVRGYLPLIRKDSSTHMHGLAVYVKEGLPFAQDLSLENSADSYLCF